VCRKSPRARVDRERPQDRLLVGRGAEPAEGRGSPAALALDQGLQPLALLGGAGHHVGVDIEGEGGASVADLAHHLRRVGAEGDQDRGEGVAQLVGGEALGQRQLAALAKQLVGALEDLRQDALSQVAAVAPAPGPGRKGEGVGATGRGPRLVGGEDVVEDRQGPDLAQARRRLRAADEDPGVGEVDVAFEMGPDPREGESFARPRP
jgi:hypothetical protein